MVELLEDGSVALFDTALATRIRLDGGAAAIALALDAPRVPEDLAEEVGLDLETLTGVLAQFDKAHLLDTDRARAIASAAMGIRESQQGSPGEVPLKIRGDARFSCTQCGSCCGDHSVGPVYPDTIEGLAPVMQTLSERTGAEGYLFFQLPPETTAPGQGPTYGCSVRGGSCVFLDDHGRCVIHADYGPEAKPRVCRLFPYEFVATPDGVQVTISQKCRGFPEASTGKPLSEDEPALRALLRLLPTRPAVPGRLRLDPATPMVWDEYMALEERMHQAVDACDSPAATWLALRQALIDDTGDPAIPDRFRSAEAVASDLRSLCDQLSDLAMHTAPRLAGASEHHLVLADTLTEIGEAARVLPERWARTVVPFRRPGPQRLFRVALHHELASKALLMRAPTVVSGFARLVFGWFVGASWMVARASACKRTHLVEQDLQDATVCVRAVFDNPQFSQATESLTPLIDGLFFARLDALFEHADDISPRDERHQIYRF